MSFEVLTNLSRTFHALETDIIKAAAGTLNATVFAARAETIAESRRVFDRPRDWSTKDAWLFTKAKPSDGANMFAELRAKQKQAGILHYQIEGGTRRKGDPGATRFDVPVGAEAANTDAFGGIARGTLKRAASAARKEKKSRATLAARRNAARAQLAAASTRTEKQRIARRIATMKWVKRSKNAGGSFFGTIDGVRGYWQRPERSVAVSPRRSGVRTVIPQGRNKPRLLLAFADRAEYRPLFRYNDVISRVTQTHMTSAAFARELARVQSSQPSP